MGATCSAAIVPDKDTMHDVVDLIVRFEEMDKRGERFTKAQRRQRKVAYRVARAMRMMVRVSEDTRVSSNSDVD